VDILNDILKSIASLANSFNENPNLYSQVNTIFTFIVILMGLIIGFSLIKTIISSIRIQKCRKCYQRNQDIISETNILLRDIRELLNI
jgi:large-conductance mechanosensitive channel